MATRVILEQHADASGARRRARFRAAGIVAVLGLGGVACGSIQSVPAGSLAESPATSPTPSTSASPGSPRPTGTLVPCERGEAPEPAPQGSESRLVVGFHEWPGLEVGDSWCGARVVLVDATLSFAAVLTGKPEIFTARAKADPNVRYVERDEPFNGIEGETASPYESPPAS